MQARVLRTIDKVGGLDEYLLGDKPARIKELGVEGWRLRWRVMRTGKVREKFRRERERLGLPVGGWMEEPTEEVAVGLEGPNNEIEIRTGEILEEIEAGDKGEGKIVDVEDPAQEGGEGQKTSPEAIREELERRTLRVATDGAIMMSSFKEAFRRLRDRIFRR